MKINRKILRSLTDLLGEQYVEPLTVRHVQAVLDIQGYYSGISERFYPVVTATGEFSGWRVEARRFGV